MFPVGLFAADAHQWEPVKVLPLLSPLGLGACEPGYRTRRLVVLVVSSLVSVQILGTFLGVTGALASEFSFLVACRRPVL